MLKQTRLKFSAKVNFFLHIFKFASIYNKVSLFCCAQRQEAIGSLVEYEVVFFLFHLNSSFSPIYSFCRSALTLHTYLTHHLYSICENTKKPATSDSSYDPNFLFVFKQTLCNDGVGEDYMSLILSKHSTLTIL